MSERWRTRLGLWAPVAAMMVALWLLSGSRQPPGAAYVSDKAAHVAAFLLLGLLCLRATHGGLVRPRLTAGVAGLALAVAYGALDEWHQSWVPDRHPSALDLLADAAGALAALPLMAALARIRARREPPGRSARPVQ